MAESRKKNNSASKRPPTIMVVDDEEMVTRTLVTYLQLETDYNVLAYQSPQEALKALQKKPVDLIISDFLMPEMDGLQFLAEARKLYPDTARILLTGYADKENAIKAINEVGLFQYLEKPWDNDRLKLVIRNGITSKNLREVLNEKIKELDNVLLERDELFEHNELFKTELMLARNVQESLLPQDFPDLDGFSVAAQYLPALEVGGDFYDLIPLSDDKFAFMIADVTGHGIQAALITVLLKAALADYKDKDPDPAEILHFMNRVLYDVLPQNLYVAGLVGILDISDHSYRLVNAGIPHPFHISPATGQVTRIPASGLLLGVTDEESFSPGDEFAGNWDKGDRLLLCTDGLTEPDDETGAQFDTKLQETLVQNLDKKGKDLIELLIESARKFSNKEHRWDDITILIIERQS